MQTRVLDIELVPWMDYTSVAAILRLAEVAKRDGTSLKCINVRPQPMKKLSHMLEMNPDIQLELVPNEADADEIDKSGAKDHEIEHYHHKEEDNANEPLKTHKDEEEINEPLLPKDSE